MPLGHALLAVNSTQTGGITSFTWRCWLKVGVFSTEDRVEINNEANWTKEMVGRILSRNEMLPDFACRFLTRLLLSCRVVDGLCYNELDRRGIRCSLARSFDLLLVRLKGKNVMEYSI